MKSRRSRWRRTRRCISWGLSPLIVLNGGHIRIQQRNGRKSITTVQGLATDLNLKLILKTWKRSFTCNGAIVEDEELGKIIQLQGDQRTNVRDFLVNEQINRKEDIVVHGFWGVSVYSFWVFVHNLRCNDIPNHDSNLNHNPSFHTPFLAASLCNRS